MDRVLLALLLVSAFVAGFFGRSILSFLFKKPNRRAKQTVTTSCKNTNVVSVKTESENTDEEFHVLGKMGYFLASNDEDKMPAYSATPLQDLDPKDLA